MEISNFSSWFWPSLSLLLSVLWLWTLLRQRKATPTLGSACRPVEAEDALKAAYTFQEAEVTWDDEDLACSLGLPARLAQEVAQALVASGWAEEDIEGSMRLTEAGETRASELIRAHRCQSLWPTWPSVWERCSWQPGF